ncbi:MAG: cold shock domain-containing protein, partial [Thermoleophilia bacterium]|nr:cold shock domain-containing protein [Thermoleophilia bacterium]
AAAASASADRTSDTARPRGTARNSQRVARREERAARSGELTPAFEQDGNGRGAPLKRTAPPRDASAATVGSGRGTISAYDPRRGFGFIKQSAGGKDVFFHRRAVIGADDQALRPGMPVTFGLDQSAGSKLRAGRVTVEARRGSRGGASAATKRDSARRPARGARRGR